MPQRILGRDLFRYLEATGLMRKTVDSRIGQRMQDRETLIGSSPRAARRRHGIQLRGRTVDASGSEVRFADGGRLSPGAVIWATGFGLDHSFVAAARLRRRTAASCTSAASPHAPGLYFLGLPWQHTRGSALLGWVKDDAEYIARRISARGPAQSLAVPA